MLGKVDCGKVMDADDGVCAFALSDPTDALTVAWRDDNMAATQNPKPKCQGHCNFGVSLVTDYLDEDSQKIKQKKIRAYRGITLLSLVERHDPQMQWDSSHPDKATKSGRTVIYEWGITPVDIVGTVDSSNLCWSDMKDASDIGTSVVSSETVVNAKGVKFNPFPLYTKVTTSYPSPVMAYLAAVGGIAATLGGNVRHRPHRAPRVAEAQGRHRGWTEEERSRGERRVMSHPTQNFAFPPVRALCYRVILPACYLRTQSVTSNKNLRIVMSWQKKLTPLGF